MNLAAFIVKWSASGAAERANKDSFLNELCDVLGVPRPDPTTGDLTRDLYTFERDAVLVAEGQKRSVGKIDLYKHGSFLLEAKQGSEAGSSKVGTARRNTPSWHIAMKDAFGQGVAYARTLDAPPPFLIACDIGYCFDLYASFGGTWDYRHFPNAQASRIFLSELGVHLDTLRAIFVDPHSLDPARRSAKVTREVAAHLAELARELELAGHGPERVAAFLMRCLFTMFAEDVGLLPDRLFTAALEDEWVPRPDRFQVSLMNLWNAMNVGGFWPTGKLLRFNGGLFAHTGVLPLTRAHLERLLEAARCNWADVEPAIFGTLLERALDPMEREALGAHFTPRAYVERLVKPAIEEPLRAEWAVVQAEARDLVTRAKEKQAEKVVRAFHERLCKIRVLDPACGSGNFLYVTLDLFKSLESEILGLVSELSHAPVLADAQSVTVSPAQFLGIEIKPWAKEIADLVLWIGYLQWHHRTRGNVAPREPVLGDYRNIERRDAVLASDGEETVRGQDGKPVTRWDGRTMKRHPVTGESIPDETARQPAMRPINPRKASWPEADFVVGNPPFIGNKRMRLVLGDGYVEALRALHGDVPETSDYVMYWWNHAAGLVRAGRLRRFGLITTNSITQTFNRKVVQQHMEAKPALSAVAVPDHPWVDSESGAAVRIAMTVGEVSTNPGRLVEVIAEKAAGDDEVAVELSVRVGRINADLTLGAAVSAVTDLRANSGLACPGVQLSGQGFVVTESDLPAFTKASQEKLIRPYLSGRDLSQRRRARYVIDTFGLTEAELRTAYPDIFQWLVERVKPERDHNPREKYARDWWLHSEPRARFRKALDIPRFVASCRTARHRVFQLIERLALAETKIVVFALDDAYLLGVLSGRPHVTFALRQGGWLGVGNDSTYNHSDCFDPFPFPAASDAQMARIRELGEALDAHRKRQQAQHPDLTITGMYNVLEKLRTGETLSAKEQKIHQQGLVSVLRQIHDDLDAAVFEAYGWPASLTDEQLLERLVVLNAERTAEEQAGLVRWLRPEFQNEGGTGAKTQIELGGVAAPTSIAEVAQPELPKWPAKLSDQVRAVRGVVSSADGSWSVEEVARCFRSARREAVAAVLESLAALGLLVGYDAEGTHRWKVPSPPAA